MATKNVTETQVFGSQKYLNKWINHLTNKGKAWDGELAGGKVLAAQAQEPEFGLPALVEKLVPSQCLEAEAGDTWSKPAGFN